MKCDKLYPASLFEFEKVLKGKSNKLFYAKANVDAAIDELKADNESLRKAVSNWHDKYCKLQEKIDNLECKLACVTANKDKEIDELKQNIKYKEGVGKRWFDSCMEARSLWVKNTRAMWLARALALSRFDVDKYIRTHMMSNYWKCGGEIFVLACKAMQNKIDKTKEILLKKAEEYK